MGLVEGIARGYLALNMAFSSVSGGTAGSGEKAHKHVPHATVVEIKDDFAPGNDADLNGKNKYYNVVACIDNNENHVCDTPDTPIKGMEFNSYYTKDGVQYVDYAVTLANGSTQLANLDGADLFVATSQAIVTLPNGETVTVSNTGTTAKVDKVTGRQSQDATYNVVP